MVPIWIAFQQLSGKSSSNFSHRKIETVRKIDIIGGVDPSVDFGVEGSFERKDSELCGLVGTIKSGNIGRIYAF